MDGKKIKRVLVNSLMAILEGKFLLRTHCDRYFPHIVYAFFLLWLTIWVSMKTENAMARVEKNKETLSNLRISAAEKTVKIVSFSRLSRIEDLLEQKGSTVGIPQNPATVIEKQ